LPFFKAVKLALHPVLSVPKHKTFCLTGIIPEVLCFNLAQTNSASHLKTVIPSQVLSIEKAKSDSVKANALTLLLSIIFLLPSCNWIYKPGPCDASGPIVVYKTKQDYSKNVTVQLSTDGKKVTAYPGKFDAIRQKPIELANGYLLKRMIGDAVLSLKIDEYALSPLDYSSTDLLNLVIDKNPYLEKFECCECTQGDTAAINDLIRNNLLPKCENLK